MKGLLIPIIIVVVLVIIGLWLAGTYNKLVRKRNNAKEGFSTMDVYLKKRFDMIPNLVETVKGYATHERETLEAVMKARSQVATAGTFNQKVEHENMLTGALGRLFAVAENYPDLNLQEQLKSVEQDIANARKFYNGTVKDLNNSIEQFPSNIVAGLFHFEKMPMFEINEESRENVQVKF